MKKYLTILIFVFAGILFSCKEDIKHEVPNDEIIDVKYSEIQSIFNSNCIGCHTTTMKDYYEGLDLSGDSYPNIVNVNSNQRPDEFLIKPGFPEESYLYRKLNGDNIEGGIMPSPIQKLNDVQINKIKVWIEEGALNN